MGRPFIVAIMFEEIFSMLRLSCLSLFLKSIVVFSSGLSSLPVYLSLYKRYIEGDSQLSSDTSLINILSF